MSARLSLVFLGAPWSPYSTFVWVWAARVFQPAAQGRVQRSSGTGSQLPPVLWDPTTPPTAPRHHLDTMWHGSRTSAYCFQYMAPYLPCQEKSYPVAEFYLDI